MSYKYIHIYIYIYIYIGMLRGPASAFTGTLAVVIRC